MRGGGRNAISVMFSENVSLNDNVVEGSRLAGIHVWEYRPLPSEEAGPPDVSLRNNTVRENQWGIRLRSLSEGEVVAQNVVTGNDVGVLVEDAIGGTVRHNTVTANGDGVVIKRSRTDLHQNVVTDNDHRGIVVEDSPPGQFGIIDIHENNIAGNLVGLDLDASIVNATRNWWGHPTGPSGGAWDPCEVAPATGLGDAIRPAGGIVCFHPWLDSPNPSAGAG